LRTIFGPMEPILSKSGYLFRVNMLTFQCATRTEIIGCILFLDERMNM
jgi:hypothetical protein